MAGKKTHEQQLRTLERKPDVPDLRRTEAELDHAGEDEQPHRPNRDARESEFAVSRGGFNQESHHNKRDGSGQAGHKPGKPGKPGPAQEKH
jgi:hypothetical protein